QLLQRRQAGDVDGRLANGGGVEQFLRPACAYGQQIKPEDGGSAGEESACGGARVSQHAPPARGLPPLSGEEEGYPGHVGSPGSLGLIRPMRLIGPTGLLLPAADWPEVPARSRCSGSVGRTRRPPSVRS